MIYTRWTILIGILIVLTGCGSASEQTEDDALLQVEQPVNDAPAASTTASSITVPAGFDFSTNKVLSVQVSMNSSFPTKMYLSVCRDLPNNAGPDLENCLTRAPIINGTFDGALQLPNDIDSLTATVWGFEPAGVIKTVHWDREINGVGMLLISE